MRIEGKCHRLGDNVSTDDIISEKYKSRIMDLETLIPHLMENLDSEFAGSFRKGDFVVAGSNFGTGSSREIAPVLIRAAGCVAVLAKSFARIFYRNSFNIGLYLLECNTDDIAHGDHIMVNTEAGEINNYSQDKIIYFNAPTKLLSDILQKGGLIAYFKKYGRLSKAIQMNTKLP